MTSPPEAKPRNCCDSYNGYPHHADCTRKGGRPVTTGETPPRQAGRHGKIWDDCEKQARADGQTMTDFVRDAITRELARRRALDRPGTPQWAGPPDHPDRGNLPLHEGPPLASAAPQCPACTSPYPHHRFALANPDGDGPAWCDHEWHDADAVTSGTYTAEQATP